MLFLFDILLSMAIGVALMMAQVSSAARALDVTKAAGAAQYMIEVQYAVNKCINQGDIDSTTPTADFWTTMEAKNCFNAKLNQVGPLGLSLDFKLGPAACTADTCTGYAFSKSPVTDFSNNPRLDILSQVVSKIGVDGGMSYPDKPGRIIGYSNAYDDPNPGGNVAGIVGIRIGANSGLLSLLSQFYKLDGSRKLTGDMNANQKNINNVNNLTTNSITFDQAKGVGVPGQPCAVDKAVAQNANGNGLVICNGAIWQRIGDATTGIASGVACATKGLTGTDAIGTGYICNGTFWVANQSFGNAGDSCSTAGQTAQSSSGDTLLCRSVNGTNVYVSLVDLMPKTFEMARYVIRDGTVVVKPTCRTGGTPAFTMVMMQSVVDLTVIDPRQGFYLAAQDSGANWVMQIRLTDNNGGNYSANQYNVQAIIKTECSY